MATLLHRIGKRLFFARYQRPWRFPAGVDAQAWEHVAFDSTSGARLAGLLGLPVSGTAIAAVVLAHPMGLAAKGFWLKHGHADLLRQHGFAVLAFDFNGFGESASGNFDYPEDVLAATEYLKRRFPSLPVVGVGASFGAGYMICALERENHSLEAVVLEAAFPSLPHYWRRFFFPSVALRISQLVYPKLERDLRPIRAASFIKRRPHVLLIHGENDSTTPPSLGEAFVTAMNHQCASVTLWIVDGAQHNLAFSASPKLYGERVVRFLKSAVGAA